MAPAALDDLPIPFCSKTKADIPTVPTFDANTVTIPEVVHAMIHAGGAVLRGCVPRAQLDTIEADIRPWLDADKPWDGDFFPPETRRVYGLAGKSRAFLTNVVQNRVLQGVSDAMLSDTISAWVGRKKETSTSRPQLNNTIIFSIGPGARDQELHRDDMIHHNLPLKEISPEEYRIGRDVGIGFFVAGKKTTRQNGATRFIPGSHLWDSDIPPNDDLAFYAELEPGDGFILLSSCYHGGSANRTENEERLVYSCFMAKGFLRQEENQYLANDPQKLKEMYDMETLKMIGYDTSKPFLGWVNLDTPLKVLYGDEIPGTADLY